jgi:hypothetical protein
MCRFDLFPFHWRQRDGKSGCQFWEWEERYEQYLVNNKMVPSDYQPVFESTKLPWLVPIAENKPTCGETSHDEQVKQLREIVKLLKCLLLVCVLVFVSNLAAIVRTG